MDPLLVFWYWYEQIMRRNGRKVSLFFTLTNNTCTTAEFDSGISYQGIEGRNNRQSVLCDILGRAKYRGRALPKKPYGTKAVNI